MRQVSAIEVFANTFPEVTHAYRTLKANYRGKGPLDDKTRELIQTAVMVVMNSEEGTRDHARLAAEAGATPDEIIQTVLMVLGPAGITRTSAGLQWVKEALAG
ncbi:MAG TPA: carboxymuconolactone decarboxylase family protein [Candidatus Latescibacteria bacterium]|nr:carboxymuconolactone decarboxylase family protein [Candidatus Latescibacterota bacterium]HQI76017.1 carboxymuconolactone decarboxylase family protein [Candidatus Latescibacterota bacterium]HRS94785.1 carboxymuconolactone decarboxylase family protein [Candidatus Latescibacterota bacterium]HRU23839.1 carboxymuconolactone decarboxylase family protein [Candidatus Latescibacterota bacterium]